MDTPDVDLRREAALRALERQLQELKMFYGAGAAVVEADTVPIRWTWRRLLVTDFAAT